MTTTPTIDQWKRGLQIAEQIAALEAEMKALMGGAIGNAKHTAPAGAKATATVVKKKGGMSAAGRARIAAAQKLRWSKIKKAKASAPGATAATPNAPDAKAPAPKTAAKKKRTMSPEVKAKLAKAMKARWAAAKAGKGPAPTARKKK